ncbi:MAG TPA: PKD domain-containing protein, partial [Anaerolineae bacterium]|nr:PKD domain-containing protein [Anaerolineae bacterium]
VPVYNALPYTTQWALANNGSTWVLAFWGTAASGDLVAMRISPDGVVLDPPTHSLVQETYYMRFNLQLACAAGTCLATFNESPDTGAVRFDSNLNVLGGGLFTLLPVPAASLVSDGRGFYVVWHQQQPDFTMAVLGSRVNTAGQKLDGDGVNISGDFPPEAYTTTDLIWDGSQWKVTWGFAGALRVARINAAGQVLDPGGVAVAGPATGQIAANSAGGLQIVWTSYVNSDDDITTAFISAANVAGPNRAASTGAPMQLRADVATGGAGYLAVYQSNVSGQARILAQPLDAAGDPLTAEPVELASGPFLNGPTAPAVAWNGSLYLVTWGTSTGIVAQRLQADGVKVDVTPFSVMAQSFGPTDVAAVGDIFLVVGRKYGSTPQFISAVGARVRGSDGAVLNPSPATLGVGYVSRPPAVVELGGRWLIAWHSNWSHDNSNADTAGVFMNSNGALSSSFWLHGPFSTAGGNGIFEIGLSSNGTTALMVQSEELTSGVETDLLARTIDVNGAVSPMTNLTPWIGNQYRPRVAWDGANFVVVYQDQRNRNAPLLLDYLDARSDLFGMRIAANGTVVDPKGFLFSNSPLAETAPTVAAAGGVSLLAASFMRNEAPLVNYRIGYEQLGVDGNRWPVAAAAGSPASGNVPLSVTFSSAGSVDPDGSIASYLWEFGDGATATTANPSHTYTVPGRFVALLTVTDNRGASTRNTVKVDATAPNQLPVAVAWASTYGGPAPLDVMTYARGSYDPDGSLGNFQWDFGDGNVYWGANNGNTFQLPGVYDVVLTSWDNRGASDTAHLTIIVTSSGQPMPGDLNGDGHVTVADLSLAGNAWDSEPGDPTWDPRLDRNGDGRISVGEVQWVAARWGS